MANCIEKLNNLFQKICTSIHISTIYILFYHTWIQNCFGPYLEKITYSTCVVLMYLPKNIIKDEKMDFLNDDISWYSKMEKTTLPKVD